jgi:succinylglutamate desuccinylase
LLAGDVVPEAETAPIRYRVVQQLTRRSEEFVLYMSDDTLNLPRLRRVRCWQKIAASVTLSSAIRNMCSS